MKVALIVMWAIILAINIALWIYALVKDYDAQVFIPIQIWLCTSIIVLYIITQ